MKRLGILIAAALFPLTVVSAAAEGSTTSAAAPAIDKSDKASPYEGKRAKFLSSIPEEGVTLDQWKAKAAETAEGVFKRLDADADGVVTRAEAEKAREHFKAKKEKADE